MQTLRISVKSGKDGVLHLRVPVGKADTEFEAVIVVQPKVASPSTSATEDLGWPPGYFETTFGSIDDETFMRQPQGDLPKPVELD